MLESRPLLAQAITTAIADFIVWVLPLPSLYRAKLPLSQRLQLITLFSFGLIVVFAACIRTYWIHYVVQETYDVTWHGFHLWMWTAVEVHLGIICGCVPWLKSLFRFWRNRKTVVELTDASAAAKRSRSDGQSRTVSAKRGTAVRMESIGQDSNAESEKGTEDRNTGKGGNESIMGRIMNWEMGGARERERNMYVDLERCVTAHTGPKPSLSQDDTAGLAL